MNNIICLGVGLMRHLATNSRFLLTQLTETAGYNIS